MDVNETLRKIRELVAHIQALDMSATAEAAISAQLAASVELAERIEALDKALTKGEDQPDAWAPDFNKFVQKHGWRSTRQYPYPQD